MKKRFLVFWNTARAFWRSLSKGVRVVIVTLALAAVIFLVFSQDRDVWFVICGCLVLAGALSALVSYRVIFKDRIK